MRNSIIKNLRYLELSGLYLVFFFLPFLKVPKNIGAGLFILGAVGWRLADKSVKLRKPDFFEWMLLAMFFSALASTVVNWPIPKGIHGVRDTFNYTLIAFFLYNNFYSKNQINVLLTLLASGMVIALCWEFRELQIGASRLFDFNHMSLGETAIFTNVGAAAMLGVVLGSDDRIGMKQRLGAALTAMFFIFCAFLMGNRAGLLGFLVFFILLSLKFMTKGKFAALAALLSLSFVISGYVFNTGGVKNRMGHLFKTKVDLRTFSKESMTKNDQVRFEYWQLALAQSLQNGKLLMGVGPRNFRSIDVNKLKISPPLLHAKRLKRPVHAHNLYLTKLCEEGIFGLMSLLAFWTFVLWNLFRQKPSLKGYHWSWIAGLGAVVIPAVAGTFNSPFQREVAWLSMLFVGLAAKNKE